MFTAQYNTSSTHCCSCWRMKHLMIFHSICPQLGCRERCIARPACIYRVTCSYWWEQSVRQYSKLSMISIMRMIEPQTYLKTARNRTADNHRKIWRLPETELRTTTDRSGDIPKQNWGTTTDRSGDNLKQNCGQPEIELETARNRSTLPQIIIKWNLKLIAKEIQKFNRKTEQGNISQRNNRRKFNKELLKTEKKQKKRRKLTE